MRMGNWSSSVVMSAPMPAAGTSEAGDEDGKHRTLCAGVAGVTMEARLRWRHCGDTSVLVVL